MIRAVLFDWGGTLSSSNDHDLLAMWRAAAVVLAPEDPEPLAARLLAAEDAWWHARVVAGDGTGSGTTEDVIRSVEQLTGVPVHEALEAYRGAWDTAVSHDPEAVPVLTELRARGLRTGLLSNTHWPRAQHERWLADAGLIDLLDARVYTSDLEHMKPHPEAFHHLLSELDVDPADAVFVGDRLRDDIEGAQGAGMRAVLLTGRQPHADPSIVPDAEMPLLSGLLDLLEGWD